MCDQVVTVQHVDDIDEVHQLDPVHQVDHKNEYSIIDCFNHFPTVFYTFYVMMELMVMHKVHKKDVVRWVRRGPKNDFFQKVSKSSGDVLGAFW